MAVDVKQSPSVGFVLYRILGNSLPPRHRPQEVVENLRFILERETQFKDCEKRWVLNRIVDADIEEACIRLIESAGQHYLRMRFDLDEYRGRYLDTSGIPVHLLPCCRGGQKPRNSMEVLALEWQLRNKSLYFANINEARNRALEDGRRIARWTLPWDGSCFIPDRCWQQIVQMAACDEDPLHLIVPLTRIHENRILFQVDFVPEEFTEPQIGFRSDSRERFDESLRYGHQNKWEMLRALGVPGPWQELELPPWEKRAARVSHERGRFVTGSWVARLAARARDEEAESDEFQRWRARFLGVEAVCQQLDCQVVRRAASDGTLPCFDWDRIQACARGELNAVRDRLVSRAEQALSAKIPTILDKTLTPPSGDKHDYFSLFPYAHVVEGKLKLLDGIASPAAGVTDTASKQFDRVAWEAFVNRACVTAIAGVVTESARFLEWAANLFRVWFVERQTRMTPTLKFAQFIPGRIVERQASGILDFRKLWAVADALKLTRRAGFLTDTDWDGIQSWFHDFLEDARQCDLDQHLNHIGSWSELTVAASAAFVGDLDTATRIVSAAPVRLSAQLTAFSVPHLELKRAEVLHHALSHLEAWICLCWFGRSLGIDLWKYEASQYRSVAYELRFIAQNRVCMPDYAAAATRYDRRISSAMRSIPADAANYDQLSDLPRSDSPDFLDDPDAGLPPMWPAFRSMPRQ